MGGIECSALEGGCRNNEMIEDIEKCVILEVGLKSASENSGSLL